MDEIDYTLCVCRGNEVFKMQRDQEEMVIKSSGEVKNGFPMFTVVYYDRRGTERRSIDVDAKDACHEIVDSFVNGYTIKTNLLLRKGIYTALGATKGKSDDIENRVTLHKNNRGSYWTKKYSVIKQIPNLTYDKGPFRELIETLECIKIYGIENVIWRKRSQCYQKH